MRGRSKLRAWCPPCQARHGCCRPFVTELGRGSRLPGVSPSRYLPSVKSAINLLIPLDDPDVITGFDKRDLLRKYLWIVHADALGPALDPGSTRIVGSQDMSPLVVAGKQLPQVERTQLDAHIRL